MWQAQGNASTALGGPLAGSGELGNSVQHYQNLKQDRRNWTQLSQKALVSFSVKPKQRPITLTMEQGFY